MSEDTQAAPASTGDTTGEAVATIPRYKSHKVVRAIKIKGSRKNENGGGGLKLEVEGFEPIKVSSEYVSKHNPQVGGYYVVYEGGYQSWSPADVFEAGYAKIVPGENPPLAILAEIKEIIKSAIHEGRQQAYARRDGKVTAIEMNERRDGECKFYLDRIKEIFEKNPLMSIPASTEEQTCRVCEIKGSSVNWFDDDLCERCHIKDYEGSTNKRKVPMNGERKN